GYARRWLFAHGPQPAASCPLLQTRNTANVRSGPGTDYEIVGQMVYLEVRPIVMRRYSMVGDSLHQ
ncbi:MAG: SH3 domain-containing protein, partial [Chloroflexi bacterium]|nr:SH3 domain-containing protein [Chloroflexota bacterium]